MKQPTSNTVATYPPRRYPLPSLAPPRRTLPPRIGYAVAALVVGLGLFASVTPSPLYRTYSVLWHFSPLTLTLIYATYAFGVLASLLLAGGVSDDVGRRPVLLAALGALMASSVLFMVAGSAAWLFVARGVQGLATGAALSAASAALLDLHPNRDPAGVGLTTATAAASGIGLGVLASSVLVQLGTLPRVLPYVLLLLLFALAFAGAYWMPEPVGKRGRFRLTAEWLNVPAVVRRPFFLAALAVISSWSIGGLRLRLPLAAGRPRRHRRRTRRAADDIRDLWQRVAAIALTVAVEAWRTRPTRPLAA
jgi:MFS family permease